MPISVWPSVKARKVLRALLKVGWSVKHRSGSHLTLEHPTHGQFVWAFHDGVEMGPKMLARITKHTGLRPEDL